MKQIYLNFRPTREQELQHAKRTNGGGHVYYPQKDQQDFYTKIDMIRVADEVVVFEDFLHHDDSKCVVLVANQLDIPVFVQTDKGLERIEVDTSGVLCKPSELVENKYSNN